MEKIRVGGVPEHFNLPWHLAIENNLFASQGLEIEWVVFKGGTGAMTQALRNNEIDVCILLTEGIVADIVNSNPSKIIGQYIKTPLIWGVFSGAKNPISHYGEIYKKQYAISRYGSGSHLMPQVDAFNKGLRLNDDQFTIIKNLDGALKSLSNIETDVFYWEKYTTKPYVDQGILKHLGDYVTPWPCFMITATDDAIATKEDALSKMLDVIYFTTKQFMSAVNTIEEVSKRYNQKIEDVENWFYSTEWAIDRKVSTKMVDNVLYTLKKAGIIEQTVPIKEILKLV